MVRRNPAGQVTDGWRDLWHSAGSALTHFKPGAGSDVPQRTKTADESDLPGIGWSMLGGDVFEDSKRVLVRLEVPGMEKSDIALDVVGNTLVVSGEKRFEQESGEGRWRVKQCAYGVFRREIRLPAEVLADQASATYRNGVLRVEFPKAKSSLSKPRSITVH